MQIRFAQKVNLFKRDVRLYQELTVLHGKHEGETGKVMALQGVIILLTEDYRTLHVPYPHFVTL